LESLNLTMSIKESKININMKDYTINEIENQMANLGYKFFTQGDYNVNTIAVRSASNFNGSNVKNLFLDKLYCIYKIDGEWISRDYKVTTVPGLAYFKTPYNAAYGTAILKPGQYSGCYQLGYHYSYPALVQTGIVSCYRDQNMDSVIDMNPATVQSGYYGINIHYSMDNSITIDRWSAGCTVLNTGPNSQKYYQFLWNYQNSIAKGFKNSFTYTLIDEF
jgi:hypothetical protein